MKQVKKNFPTEGEVKDLFILALGAFQTPGCILINAVGLFDIAGVFVELYKLLLNFYLFGELEIVCAPAAYVPLKEFFHLLGQTGPLSLGGFGLAVMRDALRQQLLKDVAARGNPFQLFLVEPQKSAHVTFFRKKNGLSVNGFHHQITAGVPHIAAHVADIALHGSFSGVNGAEWVKVLYGIVISVTLGFGLGWLTCKAVTKLFYNVERRKTEPVFKYAQIAGAAYSAFMHGAQDGQKFMGIIILCLFMSQGQSIPSGMQPAPWIMVLCAVIMALGTAIGGKKIIKSVGMDMVKLEKYQGFSADLSASTSLLLCSLLSLPVSTTHAKTTAIMGVGAVKSIKAINLGVVKEMCLTWVLTFPGCGIISFLMTKLFMWLFL